jgi:hypothetical protein
MRVFPGLFLGACFVLGMALMALFVVLLRSSLLHLVKLQGANSSPEISPYGFGQRERIKRPAFLSQ